MRLMDIRTLKLKCGDLMRDLAIARGSSNQMDELRREVFQLQRDLLQVLHQCYAQPTHCVRAWLLCGSTLVLLFRLHRFQPLLNLEFVDKTLGGGGRLWWW